MIQVLDVDIIGIFSVMYQPEWWDNCSELGNSLSEKGKIMEVHADMGMVESDISMTHQDRDNKVKLKWVLD